MRLVATSAAVLTLVTVLLSLSTNASPSVEQFEAFHGWVNWERQVIKAVGHGMLPGDVESQSEAKLVARECALADARRNLESVALAVRVTGETPVKKLATDSAMVKSAISEAVRCARLISDRQLPDRSFEVILQMGLAGEQGLISCVRDELFSSSASPLDRETDEPSGLIIDARGLGVRPAVSPRVFAEDGTQLYGAGFVCAEAAIEKGIADYPESIPRAMKSGRTGLKPMVVNAIRRGPRLATDVVVSDADAARISRADASAGVLSGCRVSIVIGPPEGDRR